MLSRSQRQGKPQGFTLIELMIVVAIIGTLAALSIPLYARHQMKTKSAEVRVNLAALHVAQQSLFAENGAFVAANPEPAAVPGTRAVPFDFDGSDFDLVGWSPEGQVYFSYAVAITADATGFTADAAADLDVDTVLQTWGFKKPGATGATVNGALGCDATLISDRTVERCYSGHSTF